MVMTPVGCEQCRNTGYMGRVGVYEIMPLDRNLRRCITSETDLQNLTREAYKSGMRPLRLSGAMKVAQAFSTQRILCAQLESRCGSWLPCPERTK